MARIPEHEIERLKQEISVQRLVEAQGIQMKRHGADLLGLCPFHDDREPSLVVSPAKNLWHCLGACQTGGSVIDWVMKSRGVSFRHAAELLRKDHPALTAEARIVGKGTTAAVKLEAPFEPSADDRLVLRQVVDYYHETLKESPEALKYLAGRGLTHPDMLEHFRPGFANRTLGYHLPEKNRKNGAEIRGRLQQLGILRDSGHEHFSGSIVIPVFGLDGNVTEMYGRKITSGLRPGTPLHTYLPGPHKGVWNEEALTVSKEIILCESLIDALTFWCADYRNVTASYGVSGFTADHREAFKRHGTKKVLIAYDRDEAGEKAAAALADELMSMGIECYRVLFPKGMDANEYGTKVKPTNKSLGVLLNKAQWLGKGKPPSVLMPEPVAPDPPPMEEEPAAKEEIATISVPSLAAEPIAARPVTVEPIATVEPIPSPPIAPAPTPPAPQSPGIEIPVEIKGDEIAIVQGDRRYRIRGLARNTSHDGLKVNVLVTRRDVVHVDTVNLYSSQQRAIFTKQASDELKIEEGTIRRDLGRILLKLEELRDEQIRKTLEPKEESAQLTPGETAAALELLSDPHLLNRILEDFERCGVIGEETNKLVGYIATVSRRLESPLAVVVQSSSAAGKSSLMDAVLAFLPEEDRVQYSAMTGQALFYMGEADLKHKVLAIVEEEGASRAAYALKLLQSEGVLTIASTGKDPGTGKLVTHPYRVEGPVMIFLTTTAIHLDEEMLNRCLVLSVSEDRQQTQAIHRLQREQQTLEGLLRKREREEILAVHRNAQRLLKPLSVVNPYARELTFLDSQTRTRRDHVKYLTLIRSIALLHQHQRPLRQTLYRGKPIEYIEVTLDDIATANRLAHEVLGRSLDELPPQTRRLLLLIDQMVNEECERLKMERKDYRFSRRDVRRHTEWGDTQLRVHLQRLEELEYLAVHRGGRGQSFVYELMFERSGKDDRPVMPGLIDPEQLRKHVYEEKNAGLEGQFAGSTRGQNGGIAGEARPAQKPITTGFLNGLPPIPVKITDPAGGHDLANVTITAGGH
jgi:DNA primase catalytic core